MNVKLSMVMGGVTVQVEAPDALVAIKELSNYNAFFGETTCGMCQSTDVVPSHRAAKGYDFYEMACCKCGATLSFWSDQEDGTLFPKRKDKAGNWLDNKGWSKYQPQQTQQAPPPSDEWI